MAAEKRSNDARVTYLTEFELSQPQTAPIAPHPMLQHERLSAIKVIYYNYLISLNNNIILIR